MRGTDKHRQTDRQTDTQRERERERETGGWIRGAQWARDESCVLSRRMTRTLRQDYVMSRAAAAAASTDVIRYVITVPHTGAALDGKMLPPL